tara:strand:+ start:371 stop:610 length:240 start_codon:yes stop_codon:yes gene_type:complete
MTNKEKHLALIKEFQLTGKDINIDNCSTILEALKWLLYQAEPKRKSLSHYTVRTLQKQKQKEKQYKIASQKIVKLKDYL